MSKIKNIEFLRIIACIAVVVLHTFVGCKFHNIFPDQKVYRHLFPFSHDGQKAVELFFMFSGFFFVLTFDKTKTIWDFIKKKVIRLYPVLIFLMLLYFILSLIPCLNYEFDFYTNILTIFALNGTTLSLYRGDLGIFWYVSAMLWVLLLYFYLLKHFGKKYVNLFAFLSIFYAYSYLIHMKGGKINGPGHTFAVIHNVGVLRAFAGVAVGYLLGDWYQSNLENIKNYIPTLKMKIFFTVLEFMCLYFTINNLIFHKIHYKNDVIFIIVFIIMIALFVSKKGYISNLLNKDIWSKFSRYTYAIYMSHPVIIDVVGLYWWNKHTQTVLEHPYIVASGTVFAILALGVFIYHFVELPMKNYLTKISVKAVHADRE